MRKRNLSWLRRRGAAIAAVVGAVSVISAGCSSSKGTEAGGSGDSGSSDQIAAALQQKTTLTFWGWGDEPKTIAKAFEQKYPNITVDVVNAGTGADEYTKLQNAVKAGKGAPDLAGIEYYALPQFALAGSLVDLSKFGLDALKSKFTTGAWDAVNINGGMYGIPGDSGPMALFYNKAVLDKFKIAVPPTWAQFAEDARKIHTADPSVYMANDPGDPVFTTSMIWQAGGQPFKLAGKDKIDLNLQDAGSRLYADTWNPMIQGGLLSKITAWTDEWYQALAKGKIATLPIGAWMAGSLKSAVPSGAGQWRVAPMPTFEAGKPATAEDGGTSVAMLAQSTHKLAAAGLMEFIDSPEGTKILHDAGAFPSSIADLTSPSFLNSTPAYFGGQQINKVLVEASKRVVPAWNSLPFQVYANSIYPNTVGQAYAKKGDLNAALKAWQEALATYGKQQGFTITTS